MKKYITREREYRIDKFEIVNKFPEGYTVWNIDRENFPYECYIPLAKVDENDYVDLTSLKTIRVQDEETALRILKTAHYINISEDNWDAFDKKYYQS